MTAMPRFPAGAPPTYYDQPAVKPSLWGWQVSGYIFIGGLAGAAQILAAAADLAGGEQFARIVRQGRYLAFAGAAAGGPLLIADLKTPRRFYNMLRIFRRTSPMSIGTYVLMGFGVASAVLAAAQAARDLGQGGAALCVIERAAEIPAALGGAAMATYTGALLSATSTPLWAAAPRLIPVLFGASAMASAAAALALGERDKKSRRVLDRIGMVASTVELGLLIALRQQWRAAGVDEALHETPWGLVYGHGPAALGAAAPAASHVLAEFAPARLRMAAPLAAAVTLAAGFALRHALLRAGNLSALRPRDYFRFARPKALP